MTDEPDDLRALIADVPAPDADRRERALAAAMAAFDEQVAPRRRSTRWLMPVAAALVGVVAIGGVISQLGGADDTPDQSLNVPADRTGAPAAEAEPADAEPADADSDMAGAVASVAATELATEMMAADAAASPAAIPTMRTDADVVDAVVAARLDADDEMRACGRVVLTEAIDERDPATTRLVLLAVEPGGSDEGGEVIVVLAPIGEPDACAELSRIALP